MSKPSAMQTAAKIIQTAAELGFRVTTDGSIFTVSRQFAPGDVATFRDCDMSYGSITGLLPRTSSGSTWGTDGSGMGGYSAIKSGSFSMNVSGGSKRVLAAVAKLQAHYRRMAG